MKKILEVRRLQWSCDYCERPAEFAVEGEKKHSTFGMLGYLMHVCGKHMPPDARKFWESNK